MPFLEEADPSGLPVQGNYTPETTTSVPSFGRLIDAAFAREGTPGSVNEFIQNRNRSTHDPSFDPFHNIQGYEDHAASFADANNLDDVVRTKIRIDNERRRREMLDAGGAYGIAAEIIAGVADPINLVPVGGEAVTIGKTGYRVARGAARLAGVGAVSAAAQEGVLSQTQETRSLTESAVTVAGAALLSGILGGAVSGFTQRELRSLAKGVMEESDRVANEYGASIGAAARRDTTIEQETLKSALGVEKALAQTSPTLRLATSPSIETRRLGQELADQPLEFRKNAEGFETPVSVESRIRLWQAPLAESLTELDDLFVQYRLGRDRKFGDVVRTGVGDLVSSPDAGTLTRDRFFEEVGYAMRRNDESDIPEVSKAAKTLRAKLFDPLKEQAIRNGQLPEDVSVETADSYLTRVYNLPQIAARRPEFEGRITKWLGGQQQEVSARVNLWREGLSKADTEVKRLEPLNEAMTRFKEVDQKLKKADRKFRKHGPETAEGKRQAERIKTLQKDWDALKPAYDKAARYGMEAKEIREGLEKARIQVKKLSKKVDEEFAFARAEKGEIDDIARQITDQLLGSSPARSFYTPVPLVRGPLKERTLNIPDKDIEDFLESDVTRIARIYTRTMSADVELAKQFGAANMENSIDKVRQNYAALRNGVTDEKKLTKFEAQMKADIRDLEAVRDRLRGTYGIPDNPGGLAARTQRVVMDVNYLRLLGGMTISAIPDLGRTVMAHGISRVFSDGIVPMVKSFKEMKLAAKEVKLAGTALDMVLDTRAMSIADVMDDYGRWSKFERGITAATSKFGLVSLMAPWNSALKQFVGIISQTRTLEAIENFGKATAKERTRLASLGISPEMAERIGQMYTKHGEETGNLKWANTLKWEDREAAETFRAHLAKEVDTTIVTPGQERPLWMSRGIGRMVGQFRSFNISSAQRVMMSGLQRRDMATLNGAAMMVGLGMVAYYLKADHERIEKADVGTWIKEGVDRSGLLGWMMDVNGVVEKATRGAVGVSRLTGGPQMTRYASRGVLESLLGPTAGAITTGAQIVGSAATGEWTDADSKAVRRMLPMQNLIGLKHVFDGAEAGINGVFGVPQKN